MSKDYRELSLQNWTPDVATVERINAGSLQRIADAAEKMASSYLALQKDRDYYKRMYEGAQASAKAWKQSHTALKGVVTKKENQIAELTRQLNEAREALAVLKGAA